MLTQWCIIPINPEPWAIGTTGVSRASGKMRGYVSPNAQLKDYQEAVRSHIRTWYPTCQIVDVECELNLYFYRRLDRYVTTADRVHARHVADATNLQKGLEDALQGVLVANDRLVRRITSEVVQQNETVEPGIILALKSPYHALHGSEIPTNIALDFMRMQERADNFNLGNAL